MAKDIDTIEKAETSEIKQKIIIKIVKYQNSKIFGDFVKNQIGCKYTDSALQKKNVTQLEDILNKIRSHLDNQNLDQFYDTLTGVGLSAIEQTLTPLYDIEGFAETTRSNPEFWKIAERFKIESDLPQIPPLIQLMFILGQNIAVCHLTNTLKKQQNETHDMKVPEIPEILKNDEPIEDIIIKDPEPTKKNKKLKNQN